MPSDGFKKTFVAAKQLLDQEMREEALELLRVAKETGSDRPEDCYALAILFVIAKADDEAIEQLATALTLDESYADAYALLGSIYSTNAQTALAVENYARARTLGSQYPGLSVSLATVLMHIGDYEQAQDILDDIPASERDDPDYLSELMRLRSAQKNYAAVVEIGNRLVKAVPDNVRAHIFLADAYFEINDHAAARTYLTKAISLNPVDEWELSNCTLLAYLLGENAIGAELLRTFQSQFSEGADALRQRLIEMGVQV